MGLILRILLAFNLADEIYWEDGFDYDGLATRLIEGAGYVTDEGVLSAFRSPGYPFFLTIIYLFLGIVFYLSGSSNHYLIRLL